MSSSFFRAGVYLEGFAGHDVDFDVDLDHLTIDNRDATVGLNAVRNRIASSPPTAIRINVRDILAQNNTRVTLVLCNPSLTNLDERAGTLWSRRTSFPDDDGGDPGSMMCDDNGQVTRF